MRLGLAKALDRGVGTVLAGCLGAVDRLSEAVRTPPPVRHVDRILVTKFWGLGNWALLRPILADLRARYPQARLTIVTLAGNAPLARDLADELHLVRTNGLGRTLADLLRVALALRKARHQLALDFEQFSRTGGLLARLGRVPQRIGFASRSAARDGLYTVTVPFPRDRHAARSFRDLAEVAGIAPGPLRVDGLPLDEPRVATLRQRFGAAPLVVLHPGSGDNFPGRRWSPAGFAALGRRAVERGAQVVVTGLPAERALCAEVARRIGPGAECLAGELDLAGLMALLSVCTLVASNDTAPVHLASALEKPVLAFFGPNTPARYGPTSPGSEVFYRALPCSPCLTNARYRSSRCRIFTCMESIPTGRVLLALDRILDGSPRPLVEAAG